MLLDRKDLPSAGAGETPIVGVAPAVAGADLRRHRHAPPLDAARAERRAATPRLSYSPLAIVILKPSGSATAKSRAPHGSSGGSSVSVPPPALNRAASASTSCDVSQ